MVWNTSPSRLHATKPDTFTNQEINILPLCGLQPIFIANPVCGSQFYFQRI